jgi:pimeloyl-ACP methyl ester carboxylesterase
VEPLVAAGHQVIAFDAPGHHETSRRSSSLPHFAWALRAVADATGETHAVIAHSLGCAAATLAVRDGMPVRRLAFIAPPLDPADYTNQFGAMFGMSEEVIDGLRRRIEERFVRQWSAYSLADAAPQMAVPLLIVHDRDDDETLWSGGAQLASLWPDARMVSTSGLGHRRVLRDPAVIEEVAGFVASPLPAQPLPKIAELTNAAR